MATVKYTYDIANDFPNGGVNLATFYDQIANSSLGGKFSHNETTGGSLSFGVLTGGTIDVHFTSALTAGEKTTLDGDTTNPAGGLIAASNSDESPGLLVHLNAYLSVAQAPFTDVTTIGLDTIRLESQPSIFTLANGEITFGSAAGVAIYRITYDIAADNSGSARTKANWWIELDTGGGFSEVAGARRGTYHRNGAQGEATASATIHLQVAAGDKIRIRGNSISGSAIYPIANGVSLTIEKIGE